MKMLALPAASTSLALVKSAAISVNLNKAAALCRAGTLFLTNTELMM